MLDALNSLSHKLFRILKASHLDPYSFHLLVIYYIIIKGCSGYHVTSPCSLSVPRYSQVRWGKSEKKVPSILHKDLLDGLDL
jgi:hypothetical protein